MRLLWLDVDSLRPDHLGCYGYHRATSPNIDALSRESVVFDHVYASDTPCLPSRTALITGQFGRTNGVAGHGGTAAQLRGDGASRGFADLLSRRSFPALLRRAGMATASITTFAERHAAWHWYAGFQWIFNLGTRGMETADQVLPIALDWIRSNGATDGWFLHVNLWDPHTPYRTPASDGDPFHDDALPAWLDEGIRSAHWSAPGPHSAREVMGFDVHPAVADAYPRQPVEIDSMKAVRAMFDGYDAGVRFADEHIGRLLNSLADIGVLDDTAVVLSADHGENLGELNVYGDHHTADEITSHLPMILKWPGLAARRERALHYQIDVAATIVELAGGVVSRRWDGAGFSHALREGTDAGREHLVLSHGAWTCQRSARFGDHLMIRTYHDGYHAYPDVMLFDLAADPHETTDVSADRPDLVARGSSILDAWHAQHLGRSGPDPIDTILAEGGPFHVQGMLPAYLERLEATGREAWASALAQRHAASLAARRGD